MIDFEILGLKFNLINTILLVILGMLLCSFTICSCADMKKVMKKVMKIDYEYKIKKFIHNYL